MLISLAVHAAALVLAGMGGISSGRAPDIPLRQPVMSAYLAATVSLPPSSSATDALSGIQEAGRLPPEIAPAGDIKSTDAAPVLEITVPTGPYYFRPSELTRRPILLGDTISRLVVELPGFPPVPVILRLLIGDDGAVDRVVVEASYLPDAVESQIVEAFANVRFLPGKIEDTAVRSQLKIEVRLENVSDIAAQSNEKGRVWRPE